LGASVRKFEKYSESSLSNHDQVVRALGMEILSGVYPPGSKLPGEAEILERFSISRTLLREVLKTLTAKGFIVSKTRVGTKVREPEYWNYFDADVLSWRVQLGFDDKFRSDVKEIRVALEPRAAALAAQRATKKDIADLREALRRMREASSSRRDFAEADLEFHQIIGRVSGNVLIHSISAVIETALVASFMLLPMEKSDMREATVDDHALIVDAIEARDADRAAEAMKAVIEHGQTRIDMTK
jgi:DNA-binding FadR family transcriptional regulator